MPKIYLAHHTKEIKLGLMFQKKLEKLGWTVINPLTGENEMFGGVHDQLDHDLTDKQCQEIVARDLDLIDEADAVFALVVPSFGTSCEIFYTAQEGKPVISVWVTEQKRKHPWVATCSSAVFQPNEGDKALQRAKELLTELGHGLNADPPNFQYAAGGEGHAID